MNFSNIDFSAPTKAKQIFGFLIVLGLVTMGVTFTQDHTRFWINFLLNSFYFVSLSVIGLFYISIPAVTGKSSWLAPYKRIPEAFTRLIPFGFVLMLFMFFGMHDIYEWTHADIIAKDALLQKKVAYLNTPFFFARLIFAFVAWIFFSTMMRKISIKMDSGADEKLLFNYTKYSALSIIVFALTYSMVSFDWVMTIEPHWFSTIFGVYTFAGAFVTGAAVIYLTIVMLQKAGYLKDVVTIDHKHDLAKLMFGFSTFWAYIWISQYLLIWYSNIPEETEYYLLRSHHGFSFLFYMNIVINWVIPFLVLMTRSAKRCTKTVSWIASLIIVGHWVDLYVMIAPKVVAHHHSHAAVGPSEIGFFLGFIGLFGTLLMWSLGKAKLVSEKDPVVEEGVYLHQ